MAISVLLGARGPLGSLLLLAAFGAVAVLVSLPSAGLRRDTSRLLKLIQLGSETTGQTPVRLTMLLLVTLTGVAAAFHLDSILGAFVAGFILRRALPGGSDRLESKLDGVAFGLLIPVFFVTSGMAIDPGAVGGQAADLAIFVTMILLLRGGPVYLATRLQCLPGSPAIDTRQSIRVALYASTGLPVIVAVTAVAVGDGQMSTTNASVLVAGGAITVLLFPMLATLLGSSPPPVVATPADLAG